MYKRLIEKKKKEKEIMKKGKVLLVALLTVSTLLFGCGNNASTKTTESQEAEVKSTTSPEDVEYTFYFLRHGQTIFNVTGEVGGGWVDSPLTPHGVAVAKTLKDGLKDIEFNGVYTSISERAWDTVNYALDGRGIVPVINEDLKELYFGSFEGTTGAEKDKCWADYGYRLQNGWVDEGGENFKMVAERMKKAVDKAIEEHPEGGNILFGSHGMAILCYVQEYYGDSPVFQKFYDGGKNWEIPNCSITKITYKNGKYELETMADTSYINENVDK